MSSTTPEIQATPNPNALKFVLGRSLSAQPLSFFSKESAKEHSIARALFEIDGVATVLILGDFVTINKHPDAKWPAIRKKALKILTGDDVKTGK